MSEGFGFVDFPNEGVRNGEVGKILGNLRVRLEQSNVQREWVSDSTGAVGHWMVTVPVGKDTMPIFLKLSAELGKIGAHLEREDSSPTQYRIVLDTPQ